MNYITNLIKAKDVKVFWVSKMFEYHGIAGKSQQPTTHHKWQRGFNLKLKLKV